MDEPQFTEAFGEYVCEGDSIDVEINGILYRATVRRDDSSDAPDERQDGFWPSLNPADAGYIGAKSRRTLGRAMAHAEEIMRAWRADEWFFCGVTISAHLSVDEYDHDTGRFEVDLAEHCASLWGIECNYPRTDKRRPVNGYLNEVANELLPEAMEQGEAAAKAMLVRLQQRGAA